MSKTLTEIFRPLNELKINLTANDFTVDYQNVSREIEIADYLDYVPKAEYFHVVLNVKVNLNEKEGLIPFYSIWRNQKTVDLELRKEILRKGREGITIDNQFPAFLGQTLKGIIGREAPRVSFSVRFDNEGMRVSDIHIGPDRPEDGMSWLKEQSSDLTVENPGDFEASFLGIKRKLEETGSFSYVLSQFYKEKIGNRNDLFFSFFNMDTAYLQTGFLTRMMLITTDKDEILKFMSTRLDKIREIVSYIRTRYVKDLLLKNRYETVKSAIAAIMSRNMSHNLGSHYLYYTKEHLRKLADEMANKYSPDVRGAAMVLGYTQARMDYLATVISNDKYPYGAINFKSQLYDELTVDDFTKRHYLIGTNEKTGLPNQYSRTVNFLLTNLILSEDFTRPGIYSDNPESKDSVKAEGIDLLRLQVKFAEDGKSYACFTGTNNNEFGTINMESESDLKNLLSSINIALPGGNMSCHAFFNVIENFIRNSAKYMREDFERDASGRKTMTVSIALRYKPSEKDGEFDKDFIEVIICDDKKNATFYRLKERVKALNHAVITEFPDAAVAEVDDAFFEKQGKEGILIVLEDIRKRLSSIPSSKSKKLIKETLMLMRQYQDGFLYNQIRNRLSGIRILGEGSELDKENKGLKEMLISSAWMRSYTFGRDKTHAEIVFDIQQVDEPERKMALIDAHCFSLAAVVDRGDELDIVYKQDQLPEHMVFEPASIALVLELPVFKKCEELQISKDEKQMIHNCLTVYADIVTASQDSVDVNHGEAMDIRRVFTRFCGLEEAKGMSNETELFKYLLKKRFPDIDDYCLSFGGQKEEQGKGDDAHLIKFVQHIWDHESMEDNVGFAYADSISGGNFTKTMEELFYASIIDGEYEHPEDEYFSLKIKESALTRITIIDERLPKTMIEKGELTSGLGLALSLRNIRLLKYKDKDKIQDFMELFEGNDFRDHRHRTHFLSIHLGLIEKIVKSAEFIEFSKVDSFEERATFFMKKLRKSFGGDDVFITIHSGRGNFSAELDGPLSSYPFISLASLESAFNNSKFLLAQLFYNTVYIGKGRINHISQG